MDPPLSGHLHGEVIPGCMRVSKEDRTKMHGRLHNLRSVVVKPLRHERFAAVNCFNGTFEDCKPQLDYLPTRTVRGG